MMQDYWINSAALSSRKAAVLLGSQRGVTGSSSNAACLPSCFSPICADNFTVQQHSQAPFDTNSPVLTNKTVSSFPIQKHKFIIPRHHPFYSGRLWPKGVLSVRFITSTKNSKGFALSVTGLRPNYVLKHNCFRGRYSNNWFLLQSFP